MEVSRIAGVQRGFIHRSQLLSTGLSRHAIAHRLHTARLTAYYPSVYLVGRPSIEALGPETAAVLFLGGRGVLSDATAGAMWDICAVPEPVDITVVHHYARSRPGLCVHRRSFLAPVDVVAVRGLPVTAPARTLIDLAAVLPVVALERALAEARVQRLIRESELPPAIERAAGLPGAVRLRALLAAEQSPAATRRELERRFLALVRDAQLPAPRVNARLHGFEVDFLWPEQRLVVETDGGQFHSHPRAFENDRRRDQILVAHGYRVIRVTWRQLCEEPLAVVARLTMALAHQAA
jgi:very-short-patch-repair endonuclease